MNVNENEIRRLYAEASVADYISEEVTIITDVNGAVQTLCYNLPSALLAGTNVGYAKSLCELAKRLDFPADYVKNIQAMME